MTTTPDALAEPIEAVEYAPAALSVGRLARRVFAVDALACPNCGGRMRMLATIDDPRDVRRILGHLSLLGDPGPPPDRPASQAA